LPELPASLLQVFRAEYRLTDPAALVRAVAAARAMANQVAAYLSQSTPVAQSESAPLSSSPAEPWHTEKPAPQVRPLYFAARGETEDERRVILAASHVPPLAQGEAILPPETQRGLQPPASSLQPAVISREADRCLRCGCAKRDTCRLRHYGALFGARPQRFQGARRELAPDATHAEIVYEPGKCILCGLCLRIAEAAGEAPGLAFVGRGFPTRVDVPFGDGFVSTLKKSARACAEACPTAALSLRLG
jgi:ferredoxin